MTLLSHLGAVGCSIQAGRDRLCPETSSTGDSFLCHPQVLGSPLPFRADYDGHINCTYVDKGPGSLPGHAF